MQMKELEKQMLGVNEVNDTLQRFIKEKDDVI